jgi:uncharacterized protein (DUF488 family)
MPILYTIGHSNHPLERFLELLRGHGVNLLVDVRAVPYSRRFPQFRKDALRAALSEAGIDYRWMGDRLGGIKRRGEFTSFDEVAASAGFRDGLDKLERLTRQATPAIMCAEREPMDCHRTILIGRHLRHRDIEIRHILADGGIETNDVFERRLVETTKVADAPLFETPDSTMDAAYSARAARMTAKR